MIEQQLYIGGNLMDMDEGTSIPLDIKSNLFQDVANMTSNNTYTVNLPKTVHNLSVLGRADVPKSSTKSPFIFHPCRYFRSGIEIISNGRATVLSIKDSIEIAIYWGIFPAIENFQSDGTKLSDLESDAHILYKRSNTVSSYADAIKEGVFYANYNPYQIAEDSDDWVAKTDTVTDVASTQANFGSSGGIFGNNYGDYPIQPCVTVRWILDLLKSSKGIDFSFDVTARSYIDTLAIPLVTRKADEQTITGALEATIADTTILGALSFTLSDSISSFKQKKGQTVTQLDITTSCELTFEIGMMWSWDASRAKPQGSRSWIDSDGNEQTEGYYSYYGNYIEVKVVSKHEANDDEEKNWTKYYYVGMAERDDDGNIINSTIQDMESQKINGRFTHKITGGGKVSLAEGDIITLTMGNAKGRLLDLRCWDGTMKASLSESDDVPFGGMFPIAKNLPEVNVMDFIKCLACITGTFPKQISSNSGKVELVSFNSIWNNRAMAVDWSRKLIAGYKENTPRSMDFSVGSYCKVNHYKWKEDDSVKGSYDADLGISNETLDAEQDVWTFPFAASDGSRVPIFAARDKNTSWTVDRNSTTTSSNELQYKGCKDRIMRIKENSDGKAMLDFDIYLSSIFKEKYSRLVAIISNAHVLTEYFNLTDIDIVNFDESIPVYLAQYGAYYAVTELKVSDSGYTEVTMIQLDF